MNAITDSREAEQLLNRYNADPFVNHIYSQLAIIVALEMPTYILRADGRLEAIPGPAYKRLKGFLDTHIRLNYPQLFQNAETI